MAKKEHTEEDRINRCKVCICDDRFVDGFCENKCQGRREIEEKLNPQQEQE